MRESSELAEDKNFAEKIRNSIQQVRQVFDLNDPSAKLIKIVPSKFGAYDAVHCHVHDLLYYQIGSDQYICKGEDVYLSLKNPYTFDYKDFSRFAQSLFCHGECFTPVKNFAFFDDPEIKEVSFHQSRIDQNMEWIEKVQDETDPSALPDPEIKALFLFYLAKKTQLIRQEDGLYENVFSHHGRDIVNEVLASVLGCLLDIPVPKNYFGFKDGTINTPYSDDPVHIRRGKTRYLVSKKLDANKEYCPIDVLLAEQIDQVYPELEIKEYLKFKRNRSNPLGLDFFTSKANEFDRKIGEVALKNFEQATDLMDSDFLDRLLHGQQDRKIQEYLIDGSWDSRIHTLDYGEVLYPELMFDPNDEHFKTVLKRHIEEFLRYLDEVRSLKKDSPYKTRVKEMLSRLLRVPSEFFEEMFSAIPPFYYCYHFDDPQSCYLPEAMMFFFDRLLSEILAYCELKPGLAYEQIGSMIQQKFS